MSEEKFYLKKSFFRKQIKDNTCHRTYNKQETVDLLNRLDKQKKQLRFEKLNTERVLSDFINMLNKLQANPNDERLLMNSRDMLVMMGVEVM